MDGNGGSDRPLRAVFHTHTRFSPDAHMSPSDLVERAAEIGLDRVAITDHGEIEGALRARELDPSRVIVGEEIRCRGRTEVIGLFLSERIPPGLSLEETVARIRDQGGVVFAPHPFAYRLQPQLQAARAARVADILEVFNSRAFAPKWNRLAAELAARTRLPTAASSDAHFVEELGRGHTVVPHFTAATDLLAVLGLARPVGGEVSSPLVHAGSVALRLGRLLWAEGRPGWFRLPWPVRSADRMGVALRSNARARSTR